MNFKYHIQKYALQRYNTILPLPDNIEIDGKYLMDLDEDEFRLALSEIHEIFKGFYKDMVENPESFGMVACELNEDSEIGKTELNIDSETGRPKSYEDYETGKKKTVTHFNKLQGALEFLFSSVNNDITGLVVNLEELKKMKVRKLPEVLKRLEEQGFEVMEDGGYLNITHENRNIFKIFATCNLSCLTWTNVAADKKLKDSCVDFIVASMFNDNDRKFFEVLHEFLLSKKFTYKMKETAWIRYIVKGKLEFLAHKPDMKSGFFIKIRLANLDKYANILETVTENVRENVLNAYYCRGCSPCKSNAYRFSYKSKKYVKCCRGCYHFYNLTLDDFPSIKLLIENELPYYLS